MHHSRFKQEIHDLKIINSANVINNTTYNTLTKFYNIAFFSTYSLAIETLDFYSVDEIKGIK